jgi:hypothetical protein
LADFLDQPIRKEELFLAVLIILAIQSEKGIGVTDFLKIFWPSNQRRGLSPFR